MAMQVVFLLSALRIPTSGIGCCMQKALYWFRNDLRLSDNSAWKLAVDSGSEVFPLFIHSELEDGEWAIGDASKWWLHHALADLEQQLDAKGLKLILRQGKPQQVLQELINELEITHIYWNKRYIPHQFEVDDRLHTELVKTGIEVEVANSSLLAEPWDVSSGSGQPYRVYTPFLKAFPGQENQSPVDSEGMPVVPGNWPTSLTLGDLELLPKVEWDAGFKTFWNPTRAGAIERLHQFSEKAMASYKARRDFPGEDGTSRLSPYLHWGQIGPREIVALINTMPDSKGKETFFREVVWREFAYHVLFHNPHTPTQPLQPAYAEFPWRESEADLQAWREGKTGYPIVDAGMRQLWQTGWMHNRVRMVVASLLVKHLLLPWQEGAKWFWDTLVDADLASNTLGWQWAGGCGADAAPYFRVFNPILQGKKFDPDGDYIREYVPELAAVPNQFLHEPWEMPASMQEYLKTIIGEHYPAPIIEHGFGRDRALAALQDLKERTAR